MNTAIANAMAQSKVTTMFDVEDLETRSQFFKIHGDQGLNLFQKLENLGYSRPVSQQKTKQWEQDWIAPVIHVGSAITATGNPNEYSFNLGITSPNQDYYEANITSPYTTAGRYKFAIQVGWVISLKLTGAQLQVRSYTQSGTTLTVTVKHTNPTKTFVTTDYPVGTALMIATNSHAEGGDQDESMMPKPLIDYSYTQFIRTTYKLTGTQRATSSYLKAWSDGGEIKGYFVVGMEAAEYLHAMHIDGAILGADIATDPDFDTDTLEPKYMTEGIIPYISRKGHTVPTYPNAFTPQLFNFSDKVIQSEWGPSVYDWNLGIDLDQQKDSSLKFYFDRTEISYVSEKVEGQLFKGNKGLAMDVNFSSMKMGNRTYCFSRAEHFSHPRQWGTEGYTTPGMGYATPIGTKKGPNGFDPLPYFGMIYRKMGDYNRKAQFGMISGTGINSTYQQSKDQDKLFWKSDVGCEHVGGNVMLLFNPVAGV